jgi:cytochrome c
MSLWMSCQRWHGLAMVAMSAYVLWGIMLVANTAPQEQAAKSVWDAVYTDAQASRGKEVYGRECGACHLDSLGGADMAPGLAGEAFLTTWNDLSVGDLFERIRISMPQDNAAGLTRQQYVDIVAYILQANKFPTGAGELVHDLPTLKAIKILSKKPA